MILIVGGEMKKIKRNLFLKKLATNAKNLMQSTSVYLFHDHVIVKKKNSSLKTPWHIDKSYFMVDSEHTIFLFGFQHMTYLEKRL